jgi:hypothetical protein
MGSADGRTLRHAPHSDCRLLARRGPGACDYPSRDETDPIRLTRRLGPSLHEERNKSRSYLAESLADKRAAPPNVA